MCDFDKVIGLENLISLGGMISTKGRAYIILGTLMAATNYLKMLEGIKILVRILMECGIIFNIFFKTPDPLPK